MRETSNSKDLRGRFHGIPSIVSLGVLMYVWAGNSIRFPSTKHLISQSGRPTAPAVVATLMRKPCDAYYVLSNPQMISKACKL